jgi:hypothetical protein
VVVVVLRLLGWGEGARVLTAGVLLLARRLHARWMRFTAPTVRCSSCSQVRAKSNANRVCLLSIDNLQQASSKEGGGEPARRLFVARAAVRQA